MDRIITAGRRVLEREGYDALTTNRVATEAGVSPGSLYQYFPDKAAIVESVIAQWTIDVADRVTAALADRLDDVGPGTVRRVLDALVTALEADAPLLRVVIEELPAGRNRPSLLALERRVREVATAYLAGLAPGTRDLGAASWVLVLSIEQLATRWILDQPDISRDQLLAEMEALVTAYLTVRTSER